ncbi:two-component transcriptional regulator, LuxR family protein [Erythrobacter sp. NAP1]|uniref:helix-turn-helix transcriptional regulator n=1 Tax=Erythrobacter sp. NAP1 TaxID=237727 RepID=UPI0000686B68|nr:LuxR C-terminal-related transcriptional regulator [Erythrobacter sp. NAP1]EAQ30107.1 two-component transcriptional regulator, LuxR family protein [Erythrobacter sp. NAP1]
MQRHFDHVETLVEISDVLTYVRDQAIKAGAARMSYHVTPAFDQQTSRTAAVYAHGFSDEWMALYAKEEFRLTDPIPGRVMQFGSLMTWQDAMSWQHNTPDQEAYFAKMKEYDLIHGFGIPLYGRNARDAYASFDFLKHVDDVAPESIGMIRSLSQVAHQRVVILVEHKLDAPALSEREVEVLTWAARGKSLSAIATILDISPDTAKTYSKRIYAKLDVSDRVGAVVKALRMGLVKV